MNAGGRGSRQEGVGRSLGVCARAVRVGREPEVQSFLAFEMSAFSTFCSLRSTEKPRSHFQEARPVDGVLLGVHIFHRCEL